MAKSARQDVLALLGGSDGVEQLFRALPEWAAVVDRDLLVHMLAAPIREDAADTPAQHMNALDFVVEDQRDAFRSILEEAFRTGVPSVHDYDVIDVRNDRVRFSSTITPIRGADGDVSMLLFISRDITATHRQQEALERALERERAAATALRDLDELKSEFVAKVVHDLRTPITVIQGFATTLEDHWEALDDAERRRFLEYMSDGADRLMRLVEDMMLVARIDSDQMPMQCEAFDLVALVQRVVEERQASIRRFDAIELVAPDVALVWGDRVRLRQVLVNLLDNALRYTPEDRPVRVAIELDDAADAVSVTIADDGPGIAAEDQRHLFERFTRVEPAVGHEGSGLGLYICRSIVEAHGGSIGVDSAPGMGSRFSFTVPADDA